MRKMMSATLRIIMVAAAVGQVQGTPVAQSSVPWSWNYEASRATVTSSGLVAAAAGMWMLGTATVVSAQAEPPQLAKQLVDLDQYPLAVCNDGSPAA